MKNIFLVCFTLFFTIQLNAQCSSECHGGEAGVSCCDGDSWTSHRPDGNAPIGVMADHYHHKGGLMVSYRYMNMNMEGNRAGTNEVENMQIFQNYMRAPKNMQMEMHMFGLMYAPGERVTLTAMMNYRKNEMNLLAMDGSAHAHSNNGIGDLKIGAITGVWKSKRQSFHLNGGLSIPTGDIDQSQIMHMENNHVDMNLPYAMQLGSGTWDVFIGGTYLAQSDKFSFGIQTTETFRTGENANDYRLGNQYQATSWLGYKLNNWASISLRGEGKNHRKNKRS